MRILFITSTHNTLSQRLWVELTQIGHIVSIELALGNREMEEAVELFKPDLIICPMLKIAIPETIWTKHKCLIVHPGIKGDRGPSSLDWAILENEEEWGVTILQANAFMDAGDIWATAEFKMRPASKSSIYQKEVVQAATHAVLDAIDKFEKKTFTPEPLNYTRKDVRGRHRYPMKQADRAIDWRDSTEVIARKIRSADGSPGVLDRIFNQEVFLYGVHEEDCLKGKPGEILAKRYGAICRATGDGSLWITHLKKRSENGRAFSKLPAAIVLEEDLHEVPSLTIPIDTPINQRTFQEIRYQENKSVGYLYFDFYNGAMSTDQCNRLREAIVFAKSREIKVLVLIGGDIWSNGIHLHMIEAAANPAEESWRNLHAINDLILEVLNIQSKLVISAVRGNAGAGGVMFALSADRVMIHEGTLLNPHYKSMGNLYGSEYWTYLLPRRVGTQKALELTENCLPLGALAAKKIGLIDHIFKGNGSTDFNKQIIETSELLAHHPEYNQILEKKNKQRIKDEKFKHLQTYREEELKFMWNSFFGKDQCYHEARRQFVYKISPNTTPRHLAIHR